MIAKPDPPLAPEALARTRWRDPAALQTIAQVLLVVVASWFLLNQLAPVLRPLMVATFLTYVLLPYHSRLRKSVPSPVSVALLAGATAAVLVVLALVVSASVLSLSEDLPRLERRAVALLHSADGYIAANAPWVYGESEAGKRVEERLGDLATRVARPVLNAAADALLEACLVGLYLLFLLLEASRLPGRVRKAYTDERADEILHIAGQVNSAVISYLKAKVKASLCLAVPVGLVLWSLDVRFPLLWAVLTFLCNFIPYLGSVVAVSLPVGFAFLQLDLGWRPFAVAGLVLTCHGVCASLVEPTLLGRAVGLSPLMILGSLAFWGLVWGIPGLFLAVPLTVVTVIVLGHFPLTRPVAMLVSGD